MTRPKTDTERRLLHLKSRFYDARVALLSAAQKFSAEMNNAAADRVLEMAEIYTGLKHDVEELLSKDEPAPHPLDRANAQMKKVIHDGIIEILHTLRAQAAASMGQVTEFVSKHVAAFHVPEGKTTGDVAVEFMQGLIDKNERLVAQVAELEQELETIRGMRRSL